MSKIRKFLLVALLSCIAVCVGFAVACTSKNSAKFREPADYVYDSGTTGEYKIEVRSPGGLGLTGVKVTVMKGSETVVTGISRNGVINLDITPDVYQLVVDKSTLPVGYYLGDETIVTRPDSSSASVVIPSQVIEATASSSVSYTTGNIMYDFAVTDASTGAKYTLAELLNSGTYKAVMLNFWYVDCNPCRSEFPAIEEAYQAYKDKVAIIALSYQDSNASIKNFADTNGYHFYMGYDSAGLTSRFGVTAFPTTVMVDRYGVIAEIDSTGSRPNASYWRQLFAKYTSDDYVQIDPVNPENPSDYPTEYTRPTAGLTMPSSAEIDAAITGELRDISNTIVYREEQGNDAEFTWPWEIRTDADGSYLSATNENVEFSYATFYAEIKLNAGDALSYEYYITSEIDNDILYVFVNGNIIAQYSGSAAGWQSELGAYVANRSETIELAFMYYKDYGTTVNNERASIRNINIREVTEVLDVVDQQLLVVEELNYNPNETHGVAGGYDATITKKADGYYYINQGGEDVLLLADILSAGYWAQRHLGALTFDSASANRTAASVYLISFWKMSNYDRADTTTPLRFTYLDDELSERLIQTYYLQSFSDNSLMPVTDYVIDILKKFTEGLRTKFPEMFVAGDKGYDGEWLEFCYYYKHHGAAHDLSNPNDHECYRTLDPIKGLIYDNALIAYEGTAARPYANKVNITKIINFGDGGGLKYTFEPERTGVYLFYSKCERGLGIDPAIYVYDTDGNELLFADNDVRATTLENPDRENYYAYVWLERGKTYNINAALAVPGYTGAYNMYIEYQSTDTVNFLRVASTGDGIGTFDPETYEFIYLAVKAVLAPDGYYYEYTDSFELGSKIYIDFVHENFFDSNGHTLQELVDNGIFDFRKNGGSDFTARMQTYCQKALGNEGELHGLIEADAELVSMLDMLCLVYLEQYSYAWEMFACYYTYIGNPNA